MIISSLLDTDLYKFTMMQLVMHRFPTVNVEYQFKLRSSGVDLSVIADELRHEIDALSSLSFDQDELDYLASLDYIKPDFIHYLANFRLNPDQVFIQTTPEFALSIKGSWLETILYEIPILAIISELYLRRYSSSKQLISQGQQRLAEKIDLVNHCHLDQSFKFTDFGTRRRYSKAWQAILIETLAQRLPHHFVGTSNVYFAKKFRLSPIGTMAHEYIQAFQAFAPDLKSSQKVAFTTWLDEYQGQLGIALSDTLGLAAFLNDFDETLAHQYTGARQDSGDPIAWAEALIQHYQELGIDPKEKTLVFSDSLTMQKAIDIYQTLSSKTNVMFGIGTHLTNDLGIEPLDMVIKMVSCNDQPVAKISDSPGKAICKDQDYLKKLADLFKLTIE